MDSRQELMDEICERLAEGESLRSICQDQHMPNKATVFRWLAEDKSLGDQYARARETQADSLFDEVLMIADTEEDTNKARVRIDARKWMAGKLRPKVYGDKIAVGGADDLPPIKSEDNGLAKLATYLDAIASRTTSSTSGE